MAKHFHARLPCITIEVLFVDCNIKFRTYGVTNFMDNISNYLNFIQQEIVAEKKTVKVARLIILLIKIEKELYTVKNTLSQLQSNEEAESKSDSQNTVKGKLATVEMLLDKIRKARLNLNYYFI